MNGADTHASSPEPVQPRTSGYLAAKGTIERIVAAVALVALSPLLALSALAIRLESPGPVIFRQRRIGRNSRPFTMYKFRTMQRGTPEMAKALLLQGGGTATITRVGGVLRRTSLDELPQLFNVVLGDMSLVGPRPALHNQYDLIEARQRAGIDRVPPGITGYAQVMGREDLPLHKKIAYDAYYVEHVSFWLDVRIFVLSFWALMTARGAY